MSRVKKSQIGRWIREGWVKWAYTLPNPKPDFVKPYEELSPAMKEADDTMGIYLLEACRSVGLPVTLAQQDIYDLHLKNGFLVGNIPSARIGTSASNSCVDTIDSASDQLGFLIATESNITEVATALTNMLQATFSVACVYGVDLGPLWSERLKSSMDPSHGPPEINRCLAEQGACEHELCNEVYSG